MSSLTVSGQSTIQDSCKGICYTRSQDIRCEIAFKKLFTYDKIIFNKNIEIKKLNEENDSLYISKNELQKNYDLEKLASENCNNTLIKVKRRGRRNMVIIGLSGLIGGFFIAK